MCVYLFHPGSHLKVKFATEAIDLKDGSSIDVIDLLLKNDSSSALDRVHLVYPHPIPLEQSETRFFKDETATWLDPGHRFNTFYQQGTVQMAIGQTASAGSAGDGGTSIGGYVEVTMPKPSDPSVDLHYKGNVQGRCQLVPYELNDQTKLDEDHWRLLEWLGWSVYTLKFNQFPIQPGEKRWLRLHASGGVQRQNRRSKSDRRKEKYLGQIRHTFEVAGPLDVRHRVRRYLGLAPVVVAQNELPREYGQAAGIIDELQELLLKKGLEVPDTQTSILDWRINLFWTDSYTDCDEPLPFGDIQPAGGAYNVLHVTKGALLEAYQYLAGERFCANNHKGLFRLRVVARRISSGVVGMLPLFAIGLALISLLLAVITLIW